MDEDYAEIVAGLNARSIRTYFQNPDQLVISRQNGPAFPDRGNSFWISHKTGNWYLSTWIPKCYLVPANVSLLDLCAEFVDFGQCAQAQVPNSLVERFHLTELSDEELATIFAR